MEKECSAITETKKVVNPRVEIDTSAPFESVKEAVDMFSQWMSQHLDSDDHNAEFIIVEKFEEQATQLEKDLNLKERQTLKILKELEAAKTFVEDLKVQANIAAANNQKSNNPITNIPRGLMFMELNQAKSNLSKTTSDLDRILASVESLNKKMSGKDSDGLLVNKTKTDHEIVQNIPKAQLFSSREVNFEDDQFKKMTEASRYEVMKAMAEIERMKNSIKMAEMRLNAAKKMEEAAKAVKAIAVAEPEHAPDMTNIFSHKRDEITLSYDEYRVLTRKAKQAEEILCKNKFNDDDHRIEVPVMEKFEQTMKDNDTFPKFKFRNSYRSPNEKASRGLIRTKDSIDNLVNKKMILQNDMVLENNNNTHCSESTSHVSLSQMLKKQSKLILHPMKPTVDGNVKRQYFVQKKKFGFIQVPIPTMQIKKKMQNVKGDY